MFSAETISKLRGEVLLRRTAFDEFTEKAEAAEAALDEWSQLLAHAEAYAEPGVKMPPNDLDIRFGATLPADRERGNADWCLCGQPQTPGMVHSLTRCYEGELDLTPALPQPGDRLILPTGPVPAPNMGAWFGSGRPPYTEKGPATP